MKPRGIVSSIRGIVFLFGKSAVEEFAQRALGGGAPVALLIDISMSIRNPTPVETTKAPTPRRRRTAIRELLSGAFRPDKS
jgi:hypothetical protein